MKGLNVLTFSRATTFNLCRKKEHNKYGIGVRRESGEPLRMGSAFHLGAHLLRTGMKLGDVLEKIALNYDPLLANADTQEWIEGVQIERGKVVELLIGWDKRWRDDPIEVVASELPFEFSIKKPGNNHPLLSMRYAGKIDGICLVDARLLLLETKTTSDKIELGSPFWQRFRIDAQVSWYMIAARKLGYDVQGVLVDAVRKPSIRRRQKDTVDDYLNRLREDIAERPEFYYARVEVPRTLNDLEKAGLELWQTAKAVHATYKSGDHYRTTSACTHPYNCEFLDVCENDTDLSVDPLPEGFERLDDVHPELTREEPHATTESAAEGTACTIVTA